VRTAACARAPTSILPSFGTSCRPPWRTLAEYVLCGVFAKSLILARVSSKRRRSSANEGAAMSAPTAPVRASCPHRGRILGACVPARDHLQPDSNTLRDIVYHIPWLGCRIERPIEGSGAECSPRCPAPSTVRRHVGRGFPDGTRDRSHCTAVARFACSHLRLDTRLGAPSRHPACCLSEAAPHSNSTLMSQPVPVRTGIPQAGDRGPVPRDRRPTVPQHGSSFPYRLSQQRADDPPTPLDHPPLRRRRSGLSCGFWCPSRHAPTSTYVQRNCR
jgi:hypothetical protein